MPIVEIKLLAGRDAERKRRLIAEVTETVSSVLGSPPEKVVVLLHEVPREHWATAGTPKSES